jgi:hypothetical protein
VALLAALLCFFREMSAWNAFERNSTRQDSPLSDPDLPFPSLRRRAALFRGRTPGKGHQWQHDDRKYEHQLEIVDIRNDLRLPGDFCIEQI